MLVVGCPLDIAILSGVLVADQSHSFSCPKYCQFFAVICDM